MYITRDKKLGQLLVERGWITGEQLIRAIQSQRMVGGRLGTCLLEMDVLDEDTLLDALSDQLEVPPARVEQLRSLDEETLGLLPPKVASRCLAVPFFANDQQVKIATLHVRNLGFLDELAFCTDKKIVPYIANEVRVYEALEKYYGYELPKRYGHLLDRLNRSRYLWDESAKILLGKDSGEMVWTSPEDAFEPKGLMHAASGQSEFLGQVPGAAIPAQQAARGAAAGEHDTRPQISPESVAERLAGPAPKQASPARPASDGAATATGAVTAPGPSATAPSEWALASPIPSTASSLETLPLETLPLETPPFQTPPFQTPPFQTPPFQTPPFQTPPSETTPAKPIASAVSTPGPLTPGSVSGGNGAAVAPPALPVGAHAASETVATLEAIATLDDVDRALGEVADPHGIADVLLRFSMHSFSRVALFSLRPDGNAHRVRGWRIQGAGSDEDLFRSFEIDGNEPSAFRELETEIPFRLGPLSPIPAHRKLASCWGGELPASCLLVPIRLRDRIASVLYGDRGAEGLDDLDTEPFRRLALKAAMAFELCILRKKIRRV